ncbi:MAG TPA: acetoacetate--CoA ligase [Jatrophihabitantaceae bacterium]
MAQPSAEKVLFEPSSDAVEHARLTAFLRHCEEHTGQRFATQDDFYRFSVDRFRDFWTLFLDWSGVRYEGDPAVACRGDEVETAEFFPDVRLNYVENLLAGHPDRDDEPAVVSVHADGSRVALERAELRRKVIAAAAGLAGRGVQAGDRVVAVAANTETLIVASLAVLAVGATLSTAAPDMGVDSILARFRQLDPTVLLLGADDAAVPDRVHGLLGALPSLTSVVLIDDVAPTVPLPIETVPLGELIDAHAAAVDDYTWTRFAFNQPLFILFSSGTTGPPKCIMHSAGGVLLEHLKEHVLHGDLRPEDTLYFHTSPAWMMWNWQLSAIAVGATIVLYAGRVFDASTLWSIVAEERVTSFGTSPSYLQFCQTAQFVPREAYDLDRLRSIMSTGAILRDEQFDWIIDNVGRIPIQSISGGTDIVGCFVLGSPLLPVYRGECQCRSLGLDVRALDPDAAGVGDLICANPFPSRPLGLYGDPDGTRFHDAYFAQHDRVWTHGDLIEITDRGTARMHGRSDSVLNIGGVRIGPAEIYAIVNAMPEVTDSMAIEQRVADRLETSRLVLLVVPATPGAIDDALESEMRRALSRAASPTHVPRLIVEVAELPRTFSGKLSEAAARDALNDRPVRNAAALQNPDCLTAIVAAVERSEHQTNESGADDADEAVRALSAIFAELLGMPRVHPDDSFFDLGGTSLALALACRLIYERLGHDIPMSAVFAAPRPRALAEFIARPSQDSSDALVLLKPGRDIERPVFLLHDATGDVLAYTMLVAELTGERPVYGVRARVLDKRFTPDATVDDMAASALESARHVQPHGPYTLIGFSFGGMLAFEMTRLLREEGEDVDGLVLLDSYVDPRCLGPLRGWWFILVNRSLVQLGRFIGAPVQSARGLWRRFTGQRHSSMIAPADQPVTPRAEAVAEITAREQKRYQPQPLKADVIFVRADERDPLQCDPVEVWQRATLGDFQVVPTAGGHNDSLALPKVAALGRRLSQLLGED